MVGRRLHVGVDAWNLLGDRRGIGRYTRSMLHQWTTTFKNDVALTLLTPEWPAWWHAPAYHRALDGPRLPVRNRAGANASDIDIIWFPWNGLSWSAAKPKVAVLHDASLFALDLPEAASNQELMPFRRAVEEGAHIITDSEFSKGELTRYLDLRPDAIDVVPLGVDAPSASSTNKSQAAAKPLPFELPYLLFVGEFERRKGIDILLEALARLPVDVRSKVALVLAGETHGTTKLTTDVPTAILGYVDESTLGALYRGATALVYPSRYEGFGLPVLEAMAQNTPVIASDAGGIPEAGGNAAYYFPSGDSKALARAISDVLSNAALVADLRSRGLERAFEMTWKKTAGNTLAVIRKVFEAGYGAKPGSSPLL